MDTERGDEKQQQNEFMLGKLKEPGRTDSIPKFTVFISGHAKEHGYSVERVAEIEKAFTEVLTNIVNYAFREVSGDIEVSCSLDRTGRMVFMIIDWGQSFNILFASDPLFKEEFAEQDMPPPSASLIKKLIDTIEYKRYENKNYLTLTVSPFIKGGK